MTKDVKETRVYPMEVTAEAIKDLGIDPSKIKCCKIGRKTIRAYEIPVSQELYSELMRPLWKEDKREERKCKYFESKGISEVSVEYIEEEYELDIEDKSKSTEDQIINVELVTALYDALNMLEELDKKIMVLFSMGKSETQIASEVGLSQKGVNKRKHKAFSKLKDLLKSFEN